MEKKPVYESPKVSSLDEKEAVLGQGFDGHCLSSGSSALGVCMSNGSLAQGRSAMDHVDEDQLRENDESFCFNNGNGASILT